MSSGPVKILAGPGKCAAIITSALLFQFHGSFSKMPPSPRSRRFCFTLNNYTQGEVEIIDDFFRLTEHVTYAVVGVEVGESGTPHLQGFFITVDPQRLAAVQRLVSPRCHIEAAVGTSLQAANYCKKDGQFTEYGTFPGAQGKRNDIKDFTEWVEAQERKPNERDVARSHPGIYLKYHGRALELVDHLWESARLVDADAGLRPWQVTLRDNLVVPCDEDRIVNFFVDIDGGAGKSWFVRYMISEYPTRVQFLSVGKRDDLCFAVDPSMDIFLFDIPRGGMEFFQYNVVEKLKDQLVFSAKYQSRTKIILHKVHVVVFCNEHPSLNAMSQDRYNVVVITNDA